MLTARIPRSLVALVATATLAVALAVSVGPPGTAGAQPATAAAAPGDLQPEAWEGARWLASQITDGGFIADPNGDPAASNTMQTALALAAAHIQEPAFDAAVAWVEDNVEDAITPGGADSPGAISYAMLLAVAAGADATDFGGVDLVDRLAGTLGPDGMYGGAVEGYDPTYSAVYNQGLALAALVGAGEEVPEDAASWLLDQQCDADSPAGAIGGWSSYRVDTEVPCTEPDPMDFTGPDTNSTALAMQGLAAAGIEPVVDPLPFLHTTQEGDGGFPFLTGTGSDPNSTALVIQGLVAFDQDPASEEWSSGPLNPFTSLASWQIPTWQDWPSCSLEDAGGITSPFSGGFPDQIATQQGVWGQAAAPFPLAPEGFYGRQLAPSETTAIGEALQATLIRFPPLDSPVPVRSYEILDAEDNTVAIVNGSLCTIAAIGLPEGTEQSFRVVALFADQTSTISEPSDPVVIEGPEKTFSDVQAGQPFYAEINWSVVEGIANGFDDGSFRPAAAVTRQAMAAFLYRFAGEPDYDAPDEPTFPDVPLDHPFYKEIEWLSAMGITTGFEDGDFQPNDVVTRQAMAAFLYRFAGEPDFALPDEPTFPDVPVDHPFYDEIEWLAVSAVATGYEDGDFQPSTAVARQAMVTFMYRYTRVYYPYICGCG